MSKRNETRNEASPANRSPSWISDPSRPRDPETGHLKLRVCELYTSGHSTHHIQANRSTGKPHRQGQLIEVTGNTLSVDFGEEIRRYRNHDPDRLLDIIGIGGEVGVCESYTILRSRNDHYSSSCFSIVDAESPWIPCDYQRLKSTTPQALADRLETHCGFVVSGVQVLKGLEDING